MKDLFGKAILDFQQNNTSENLLTETNISEPDVMEVSYLFREFANMPKLEQKALDLAFGSILDVGCGAGSHSLYLQENKNYKITAIDISANAIECCKLRGVKNALNCNLLELNNQKFDTILLLMNGTGIFGTYLQTDVYLQKLKSLLNPNGQILLDSSDIIYMYNQEDIQEIKKDKTQYYGELNFTIHYKNETEKTFPWLYLDFETLKNKAKNNQLQCELIQEGNHYDYLAKLTCV
jgi:cyclopropane fatty-acyl-phospholipid synthase-like methyltransferase